MNLKAAADMARQRIAEIYAADPQGIRLESWVYDDHLMVWSLTVGYAPSGDSQAVRTQKVVRVSETNRSVLSINDL